MQGNAAAISTDSHTNTRTGAQHGREISNISISFSTGSYTDFHLFTMLTSDNNNTGEYKSPVQANFTGDLYSPVLLLSLVSMVNK